LRVIITDWPPISVTSVSPGAASSDVQPTTTHVVRKIRSCSSAKNSSEVYASGIRVDANATGRRVAA